MSFFEFPNTRTYDSDLGWLIKNVDANINSIEELQQWSATHKAEYDELANKVEGLINNLVDVIAPWDSSIAYHIYSIVEYQGTNYIAIQDVPIGAMITNTDYWQPANTIIEQINAIGTVTSETQNAVEALNNRLFFYTPEMYGAAGDGVTDDTAAIQAALDAMPNSSCLILQNNYLISNTLTVTADNISIASIGGGTSYVPQLIASDAIVAGQYMIIATGSSFSLKGFSIVGNFVCNGLKLERTTADIDANVRDMKFKQCVLGVRMTGRNLNLQHSGFSHCKNGIHADKFVSDGTAAMSQGLIVADCRFHSMGMYWHEQPPAYTDISGIESYDSWCIIHDKNDGAQQLGIYIHDCIVDGAGTAAFYKGETESLNMINNTISRGNRNFLLCYGYGGTRGYYFNIEGNNVNANASAGGSNTVGNRYCIILNENAIGSIRNNNISRFGASPVYLNGCTTVMITQNVFNHIALTDQTAVITLVNSSGCIVSYNYASRQGSGSNTLFVSDTSNLYLIGSKYNTPGAYITDNTTT